MKTLTEFNVKNLSLKNRIVMPPMCMYSSDKQGLVKDFHKIHYATRALGGVGLIIVEATAVVPNGRITSKDLGIWSEDHVSGLKSLVEKIKSNGSLAAIQLAHAGRKCMSDDPYVVAPSPIRFSEEYRVPRELSVKEIKELVLAFKDAARRSNEAGFDAIEIHAAHGYLVHEFLSPLSNRRTDEYGGNLENRCRFLKEILEAIKEVWPMNKAILLRVSADDYTEGGINKEEIVKIINEVKNNIDIVDVSSGGLVGAKFPIFPGYQVSYAEAIRRECGLPTIAVGLINEYDHIEEILSNHRADLVAIGRGLLRDPHLVLNMAYDKNLDIKYPSPYERGFH